MSRKDCERFKYAVIRIGFAALAFAVCPVPVEAGQDGRVRASSIRVWPTAVVTGSQVTLGDVCDFSAVEVEAQPGLSGVVVTSSPAPGESKRIELEDVRRALQRAGANPAAILLIGSTTCRVSNPAIDQTRQSRSGRRARQTERPSANRTTLIDAVRKAFQENARRLGGKVDVQIGRASENVLSLAEPEYTFVVRNKKARWIGKLIPIEVDVMRGNQLVRSVPLVATATITMPVLIARRSINQKATVRRDDVQLAERVYENAGDFHALHLDEVVGRRAKRFIPAGTAIRASNFEEVPLVLRGQVVEVISRVGMVEVRSAAKALSNGSFGEIVELRSGGRRGVSISAIVIGAGRVRIGGGTSGAILSDRRMAGGVSR